MRDRFWERFELEELSATEWEALCDGCGRCCLVKLQDDDTDEVFFTSLACRFLDADNSRCSVYDKRFAKQPDCLHITPALVRDHSDWLPLSCAYRRINEKRGLADWHPLLSGDSASVKAAGISVAGRVQSEAQVPADDQQEYVIRWVN